MRPAEDKFDRDDHSTGWRSFPLHPANQQLAGRARHLFEINLTADQLNELDTAADAVSGNRFRDMNWVSAGRE